MLDEAISQRTNRAIKKIQQPKFHGIMQQTHNSTGY